MGIHGQKIDIGNGSHVMIRNVYDVRLDPESSIETGYVKYDNHEVPVWRPYEAADKGLNAKWKNGTWKNIFAVRMSRLANTDYVAYETGGFQQDNLVVRLPKVEIALSFELREYLNRGCS